MSVASDLQPLIADLCERHGCHTLILYGSRARGDWTPASDWDLLAVRAEGERVHDVRTWQGAYLDVFVYPEAEVAADDSMLRLLGARILHDETGFGRRLLEQVAAFEAAGRPPLPDHERTAMQTWLRKMADRIAPRDPDDLEAHYRRAWLLMQALEDHFALQGRWYLGSKAAFAWLKANDPAVYGAFRTALQPGADLDAIRRLVAVISP